MQVWAFEAGSPADRGMRTRAILGRYTGLEPDALVIDRLPSGKPVLATAGSCPGLRYNASAAGALNLLAVRLDENLGVDIETLQAIPDAIARRAMTRAEQAAYDRAPAAERAAYFFSLWTRKEAATKVRGQGLRQAFEGFVAGDTVQLQSGSDIETVWIRPIPAPRPGHVAAVASGAPIGELRLWSLLESSGD